jgi:hypothetical protein
MRTMHATLAAVADRLGMPRILPDPAGFAELVVAEVLPIYLRVADEYELELSAHLVEFDGRLTPDLLMELLRWNGRFNGLRFAVEPDRAGVILGRRLDIRILSDARICDAVESFLCATADWRKTGANELLERVKRYGQSSAEAINPGFRL